MRRPVWKVVKKNRTSCFVERCRYQLTYKKGEIVKAREETLGIFCFKRKKDAENFIDVNHSKNIIIKVEPIGRGKKAFLISRLGYKNFKLFYSNDFANANTFQAPCGTICYPSIKVLE